MQVEVAHENCEQGVRRCKGLSTVGSNGDPKVAEVIGGQVMVVEIPQGPSRLLGTHLLDDIESSKTTRNEFVHDKGDTRDRHRNQKRNADTAALRERRHEDLEAKVVGQQLCAKFISRAMNLLQQHHLARELAEELVLAPSQLQLGM